MMNRVQQNAITARVSSIKSSNQENLENVYEGSFLNDLKLITKIIKKKPYKKRNYVNIPNELRIQLIEAVQKHGESILCAAERLKINYSAAKSIWRIYTKEGRTSKKGKKVVSIKRIRTCKKVNAEEVVSPFENEVKEEDDRSYKREWIPPNHEPLGDPPIISYQNDNFSGNLDFSQDNSFDPIIFQKLEEPQLNDEIIHDHSFENTSSLKSCPFGLPQFSNSLPPVHIQYQQMQNAPLGFDHFPEGYCTQIIDLSPFSSTKTCMQHSQCYENPVQLVQGHFHLDYEVNRIYPLASNSSLHPILSQVPTKMGTPIHILIFIVPSDCSLISYK